LTAHLVRAVNLRLLDGTGPPADPAERERLVAHWHRVNRVRLAVVAAAAVALRAGTQTRCVPPHQAR
jgi:hypothetical protein